jgi:hypothetical protein
MHSNSKGSTWQVVATKLARDGFAVFDRTLVENDEHLEVARAAFFASCYDLPQDYSSKTPGRNRRYGQFVFDSQTGALELVPPAWDSIRREFVTYYQQQGCFNPEHAGEQRCFASLTKMQSSNVFLRRLIRKCFVALPWTVVGAVVVGIHIIEFVVHRGCTVVASPSKVHCDGEPFTWAFLVTRTEVTGGENVIATIDACGKNLDEVSTDCVRARLTLEKPLDGWVVDDLRVSHYVGPVTAARDAPFGRRTMLLVDFTPKAAMDYGEPIIRSTAQV